MNAALLQQLEEHEGFRSAAYRDSRGFWTIGIGRLVDARKGGGVSREEARYLLKGDIARFTAELDARLPWWRDLDEIRQRVILDMAFNLGVRGLQRFRVTLGQVRDGHYVVAARHMRDSRWYDQVGVRAERLAQMMETGEEVALDDVA